MCKISIACTLPSNHSELYQHPCCKCSYPRYKLVSMNDAYVHDTREDVDHFVLLTGSLDSDRQVLSAKDLKQIARTGSR